MAQLLTKPVGTPIYDEMGRVIGFEGLESPYQAAVDTPAETVEFPEKESFAPPQLDSPEPTVKPFKRKYTAQYVPKEEGGKLDVQQAPMAKPSASFRQAVGGKPNPFMENLATTVKQVSSVLPPVATSADWNSFVEVAKRVAQQSGFPLSVILGQAALETGRKAFPGNNFFGIKGAGTAGSQSLRTREAGANGMYETRANFAAYRSPEDSINAYINLIKNNYPQAYAQRNNPKNMITAIKAGGYATDPNYVAKVMGTPEFQQNYRVPVPPTMPKPAVKIPTPAPAPKKVVPMPTPTPKPAPKAPTKPVNNNIFAGVVGGVKKFLNL